MTKSMRALLVGAALSGFVAGTSATAMAQGSNQKPATDTGKKATKSSKSDKHCCKGQNSCKGKGGCGETKGKNDCKGQGGCSTKSSCAGKGPCAEKKTSDKASDKK
jgi:hypothetical protein